MKPHACWVDNLRRYRTIAHLKKSAFFAECGARLETYLSTPQTFPHAAAVPRLGSFLRIAQWNIEKGKRFDPILDQLKNDPVLQWADVIILNECDFGMNRSGNRHICLELADALGMNAVFGPAHFELTKGVDEELELEGENRESLQGNAVLSRYPVSTALAVPLPVTFEPYEFHEKRYGRRSCVWARIEVQGRGLWVGSVHLELRNTPRDRARQVRHILAHLPEGGAGPCILGGDLNTNSFSRGNAWRTAKSVARLLISSPERMKKSLLYPDYGREPLFAVLKRRGFHWDELNSHEETGRAALGALEESRLLPGSQPGRIMKRLEPYHGYLCFKLDWFVGKGVRALGSGQKLDRETGVWSVSPGRVKGDNFGPARISDHLPIYVDIEPV